MNWRNKSRKKNHPIYLVPIDELKFIIQNSTSLADILRNFELETSSANYRALKNCLNINEIDYSHIKLGLTTNKNKYMPWLHDPLPLEDVLIEFSTYSRSSLKERLLKEGLLENKCSKCGLGPEWQGHKLSLQIDHINGIGDDNRLENLRLLCPNCHSQTSTFGGKHRKKKQIKPSEINPDWRNAPKLNIRKVERPSKEELEKLIWQAPTTKIAEQFGISDGAVTKWCKAYGITKPPRGYWSKKK